MELKDMLTAVSNDRIEFVTMRPQDSKFVSLDRRVVVTGPAELVRLSETGDVRVLEELVNILREPDRDWAAEVLLAAMTRREEKVVDSFAATPDRWRDAVGKTAYDRWSAWLNRTKQRLTWDSQAKSFVEQ